MSPDVTVVIPTHNRRTYLDTAISSCFDGNESLNVEVIVVDDGSTDGTREFLETLDDRRVRCFFQENQGPQVARNKGLGEARGEFIKFLDDDDWLASGALSMEIEALRSQDGDMCSGDLWVVDEGGSRLYPLPGPRHPDPTVDLLSGRSTTNPLRFTLRRSLIEKKRWKESLRIKQDVHFFLLISAWARNHVTLNSVIGYNRKHSQERVSESSDRINSPQAQLNVLIEVVKTLLQEPKYLTTERVNAARQGLWQWLHLNTAHWWDGIEQAWMLIDSLQGAPFLPSREHRILSMLDRMIGPLRTERIMVPFRRLKHRVT